MLAQVVRHTAKISPLHTVAAVGLVKGLVGHHLPAFQLADETIPCGLIPVSTLTSTASIDGTVLGRQHHTTMVSILFDDGLLRGAIGLPRKVLVETSVDDVLGDVITHCILRHHRHADHSSKSEK